MVLISKKYFDAMYLNATSPELFGSFGFKSAKDCPTFFARFIVGNPELAIMVAENPGKVKDIHAMAVIQFASSAN